MPSIYSLSYCSVAQGCSDSMDRRIQQRAILKASLAHNGALGLTGTLLCGIEFYAQVLEGEREVLLQVFRRIEADPRHAALRVLSAGRLWQRQFPHWSMAGIDLAGSQNSSIERILSRAHSGEAAAVPLLHTLLERLVESEPVQLGATEDIPAVGARGGDRFTQDRSARG